MAYHGEPPELSVPRAVGRGILIGVLALALEVALMLKAQAVGIDIDVKGPLKALLDAAGGQLLWLSVRVLFAYLVGFTLVSLVATGLAFCVAGGRAVSWALMAALLFGFFGLRAIRTPALFDDLPGAELWLTPIVNRGEPWHVYAFAGVVALLLATRAWRRHTPLRFLSAAFLVVVLIIARNRPFARVAQRKPLVVVFGIDALRPDRLAQEGGTRGVTPNVDRVLRDATSFARAYTPVAATEAAWRSILTARLPSVHGVRYALSPESERNDALDTFAKRFKEAGFTTVFSTDCSRFHYQTEVTGFSVRHQPPRGAVNFLFEKLRFRALPVLDLGLVPELTQNRALAGMYDAEADIDRIARDLISQADKGPLLYVYHATAAHFPGDPQYPFYRRYVPASEPLSKRLRMHFQPIVRKGSPSSDEASSNEASSKEAVSNVVYAPNEALYDELIAQADMQLGVLRKALVSAGLYEDATLVVLSDHGEDFYETLPELRGELSVHGAVLNEAQNHVVLAIKPPRSEIAPTARRDATLVSLLDVGPTVLELAHVSPFASETEGRSLVPILRGKTLPRKSLEAETAFTHASPDVFDADHYAGALRTFEAYDLRPDGRVSVKKTVHDEIMREKDFGVFDGETWVVRSTSKLGEPRVRCTDKDAHPVSCEAR
jgi:arylsulfatase A-like enzyme